MYVQEVVQILSHDMTVVVMADQLFLSKLSHKVVINIILQSLNQELLVEVGHVAGLLH
jgi:hypothetical protein